MVLVLIQVLIAGLLTGLVGIIWMVARDIFGGDHHADDTPHGNASPAHHDGEDPHDRSLRHSKAA